MTQEPDSSSGQAGGVPADGIVPGQVSDQIPNTEIGRPAGQPTRLPTGQSARPTAGTTSPTDAEVMPADKPGDGVAQPAEAAEHLQAAAETAPRDSTPGESPAAEAQPGENPAGKTRRLGLDWGRDVLAVLGFFTRLPVKAPAIPLADAARAFPLVGALIGLVGFLAYMLAARLGLSDLLAALFALTATALVTGALHEDGLADLADMLGVRGGRERKLMVMRDSTIGSYGVLALVIATLLKLGVLAQLSLPGEVAGALISAHVLGRAVLPVVMRSLPMARPNGLAVHAGKPAAESMYWSLGLAVLIVGLVGGPGAAIVATVSALVAAFLIAKLAQRQIGGYTGDVLGAIEQIVEIAVLINFATFH